MDQPLFARARPLGLLLLLTVLPGPGLKALPDDPRLQDAAPRPATAYLLPEPNLAFAALPAGTFWMGSPTTAPGYKEFESPATLVTISRPFWMSRTEVTQEAWEEIMGDNPSEFLGDPRLPVETVDYGQAVAFCRALTEREAEAGRLPPGYVYRLPTEAEWEYACRADSDDPFPGRLIEHAWHRDNSGGRTHPVASLKPNPWGLYDMLGNVFEWTLNWVGPYPGGMVTDPPESPISGERRATRGGSWVTQPESLRPAERGADEPDALAMLLGFRVVLAPDRG
ncbi:MAG: formylglycine-generating enzyme family protein [Opitutales bacterium]